MMAQVSPRACAHVLRRLLCFTLFWHTLDIVWVGVFTVVYLMGVGDERRRRSVCIQKRPDAGRRRARESHGQRAIVYGLGLGSRSSTIASFVVSQTVAGWPPGIPVGLMVLAIAQIGVHLVFFLHLSTGPDSTNNILALAFGVLIVFLVIAGSIWIIEQPQRQHDADVGAANISRLTDDGALGAELARAAEKCWPPAIHTLWSTRPK